MSEPCSCPIAGRCIRHGIRKGDVWHQLCQSNPKYRAAWDIGRGPGQPRKPLTPKQLATKQRVHASIARKQRLIAWLEFLRLPAEVGAGSTAQRLDKAAERRSPDAHAELKRLLEEWVCKRSSAVERLNEQYPYKPVTKK